MAFNLADFVEHTVDAVPDRTALICGDRPVTFAELEDRANRLAHHLAAQGVGERDHVAIYSYNSIEFVETMLAAFKLRAVPINVNYRYVEDELRLPARQRRRRRASCTRPSSRPLVDDGAATGCRCCATSSPSTTAAAPPPPDGRGRLRGGAGGRSRPSATSGPAPTTTSTSSTPAARPATRRASCGGTRTCGARSAAASTS